MTTTQLKTLEKLANQSAHYARKAIEKSEEFETYASFLEYKAGNVKKYSSVAAIFRAAKALKKK